MDRRHARYPFLSGAREAVEAADVDLATLVAERGPPVERARERVETAIEDGTVGESVADPRTELLSYPIARVLVSLIDEAALTDRYAGAEAATASNRLGEDLSARAEARADPFADARRRPGRGGDDPPVELGDLLADFGLETAVRETADGYRVRVDRYVSLSADLDGRDWRLVNRRLADGWVPVTEEEFRRLLREAVRERVARDLPLALPAPVVDPLEPVVESVRGMLADLDISRHIDVVLPELFPPCMKHLLERAREGDDLDAHSRFEVTAFLAAAGLSAGDIAALSEGLGEEETRHRIERLRGDSGGVQYAPPSCAAMEAYGDCVDKDDLCEQIAHPIEYYETRIEADGADHEDWRDR